MSITVTSPITGSAQTGLTSPTYTVVVDTAPAGNPGEQVAVTALGGTQTGVRAHSISSPFTLNFTRPASPQVLPQANPITGRYPKIPVNRYTLVTRKGVLPLANLPYETLLIKTTIDVPAGADVADASNIRAGLSSHIGALSQQSAGFGDLLIDGIL